MRRQNHPRTTKNAPLLVLTSPRSPATPSNSPTRAHAPRPVSAINAWTCRPQWRAVSLKAHSIAQKQRAAEFQDRSRGIHLSSKSILDAISAGSLEDVVEFLGDDSELLFVDEKNRTLLHFAAVSGHTDIVEYLLDRGAKISEADINGNTPLHLAVLSKRLDCVLALLRAGAVVDAKDIFQRTPLELVRSRLKLISERLNFVHQLSLTDETLISEFEQLLEILTYYNVEKTRIPIEKTMKESDGFIFPEDFDVPENSATSDIENIHVNSHKQSSGSLNLKNTPGVDFNLLSEKLSRLSSSHHATDICEIADDLIRLVDKIEKLQI